MPPRPLDTQAHAVRREAFVDVASRLIQVKGYEHMSIQDVLDELGASRGAFYHYFHSKTALLEAVVARVVDAALTTIVPVVDDPTLPALRKLEGVFNGIVQSKMERTDLMLALARVWLSDENTLTRDKMWQTVMTRLSPLLARVIREGGEQGVFTVSQPDEAAQVVVVLMHGLNDLATRAFVEREADGVTLAAMEQLVSAYMEALERILGVPAGSLELIDRARLREWFA